MEKFRFDDGDALLHGKTGKRVTRLIVRHDPNFGAPGAYVVQRYFAARGAENQPPYWYAAGSVGRYPSLEHAQRAHPDAPFVQNPHDSPNLQDLSFDELQRHGYLQADEDEVHGNGTFPEDYYAAQRKKEKMQPLKIDTLAAGDSAYAAFRLARKKRDVTKPVAKAGLGDDLGMLRSALSVALQDEARARGVPFESSGQLNAHLSRYAEAIQELASRPATAAHPKVAGLIQTAQRLVAPVEGGKDDTGRDTLSNPTVTPGLREVAGLIRKSGLLTAADAVLSRRYDDHVPFSNYNPKTRGPRPAGFVELPSSMLTHDAQPHEVASAIDSALPGKIKPASDETVKPASLAPAAKKARREEAQAGADSAAPAKADEDAPLPLAESPEDAPGRRYADRHRDIGTMIVAQHKPAAIVDHLTKKYGISTRAARDTFARWVEARRIGLDTGGANAERPTKLARERSTQSDPQKRHQVADLYANVNPLIAGTRLAMHLIQIAKEHAPRPAQEYDEHQPDPIATYSRQHPEIAGAKKAQDRAVGVPNDEIHALALHALRGTTPKGFNGDVFATLGDRLNKAGHRYAGLYNWGHKRNDNGERQPGISRSLKEAEFMRDFLAKHVVRPEGMSDRHFYAAALKQFARDEESKQRGYKNQGAHDAFWKRLKTAFLDRPHLTKYAGAKGQATMEKRLTDALYRLHTLADDRETTADIDATKDRGWRTGIAMPWANKHMKFSRADLATLAIIAHTNSRVRLALTNRGVKFDERQ